MARKMLDLSDDDALDQSALMKQLTKVPSAGLPADGVPTSSTMPVDAPRSITPVSTAPAAPPRGADFGRMTGYDQGNWDNGMDSLKYNAGRIFSRYAASPEGMAQAMQDPEFRALAPNARLMGSNSDIIDFGGIIDPHSGARVGRVDVGRSFDANNPSGEQAWQWMDLENDGGGDASGSSPAAPSSPSGGGGLGAVIDGIKGDQPSAPRDAEALGSDPMAAIMKEIQALQNGDSTPMDQDALMQLLGAV